MIKKLLLITGSVLTFSSGVFAAGGGGATFPNHAFSADVFDKASLQRGARNFMNYCSGCHSLQYQRYNRMFKDLGIDPDIGEENLIFTDAKAVDLMHNSMALADGVKWFGAAPPDLSLTARAKGGKYIYNYLQAFYVDDSRPLGFNNSVFPGASMPNPMWTLQGLQTPVIKEYENCDAAGACETSSVLVGFAPMTEGELSAIEYGRVSYDLANFLVYVSDPSAAKRLSMGPWVLGFIVLLTILFYLLKREYWRDIH